jgi:hypothetical protein
MGVAIMTDDRFFDVLAAILLVGIAFMAGYALGQPTNAICIRLGGF